MHHALQGGRIHSVRIRLPIQSQETCWARCEKPGFIARNLSIILSGLRRAEQRENSRLRHIRPPLQCRLARTSLCRRHSRLRRAVATARRDRGCCSTPSARAPRFAAAMTLRPYLQLTRSITKSFGVTSAICSIFSTNSGDLGTRSHISGLAPVSGRVTDRGAPSTS